MLEKFYEKKQLLAQRDTILEEIGQDVFDAGDLPKGFEDLPNEFQGIDKLLHQLRDRYRVLKEDHDKVHYDHVALLNKAAKIEHQYNLELRPYKRQHDEVVLKEQYLKDQDESGKRNKPQADLDSLSVEVRRLDEIVEELEQKRKQKLEPIQSQIQPLEEKLRKYDHGLSQVEEEEEHLSSKRDKRLQDLGYYYHHNRIAKEQFGDQYSVLDDLREKLTDNRKTHDWVDPLEETTEETRSIAWAAILVVGALLVIFFFRTEYERKQLPLSGFTSEYRPEAYSDTYRLYMETDTINTPALLSEVVALETLPGGSAFSGKQVADLQHYLMVREEGRQGEILLTGLVFKQAPSQVAVNLGKQGWKYLPSSKNWELIGNDRWVWAILTEREFLLFRRKHLNYVETFTPKADENRLRLHTDLPAFGNNYPILKGFDRLTFSIKGDQFQMHLTASQPLPNMAERSSRIQTLEAVNPDLGLTMALQDDLLNISGNTKALGLSSLADDNLASVAVSLMDRFRLKVPTGAPESQMQAELQNSGVPFGQRQGIQLIYPRSSGLIRGPRFPIGNNITGLDYWPGDHSLIVADPGVGYIYKLKHIQQQMVVADVQKFEKTDFTRELASFTPTTLKVTPGNAYAVALDQSPKKDEPAKLVLLRLSDLEPTWVEELPEGVQSPLCVSWDANGQDLFIGVSGRKRRGSSSWAVLLYRRDGATLHLSRLIDLNIEGSDWLQVPSVAYQPSQDSLYFYQYPYNLVSRYRLDRDVRDPIERLRLKPQNMAATSWFYTDGRLLSLNRDQTMAVAIDYNQPLREPGDPLLRLIATGDGPLELIDSLDIESAPFSMARKPLTDVFWLTVPKARKLVQVRIENRTLVYDDELPLPGFVPHLVCSDRWGDTLFVVGPQD